MRIAIRIFNIILGLLLLLVFILVQQNDGYAEMIGIAPLTFSDLFLAFAVSIGPVILVYNITKYEAKELFLPLTLFALSIGSFYLAYKEYPTIKQQSIKFKLNELDIKIGRFHSQEGSFFKLLFDSTNSEDIFDSNEFIELEMLKSMYKNHYNFLERTISVQDIRIVRLTCFLGLLGLIFLVNSIYYYINIKAGSE